MMAGTPLWRLLVVFAAALLPRLLLALFAPAAGGDTTTYAAVAGNILHHGCVSLSDPATGACMPHWGGNQLPGYPAFLALVWFLAWESWTVAGIAQSLLFATAAAYLYRGLDSCLPAWTAFLAAMLVALSPLTVPWARFALGDTLALALGVWVLAEVAYSLGVGRLLVVRVAVPFALGLFVRYDGVFYAIPVAIAGFYLHSPTEAVRRGLAIALLTALPLGAWWTRSIAAGLPWMPPLTFMSEGRPAPIGYLAWGQTWATTQYQAPLWWYPVRAANYDEIRIEDIAYANPAERQEVERLLFALAAHAGRDFPEDIDQAFMMLARKRQAEDPVKFWLTLPLQRIWQIWFNPYDSAGWPVSIGWQGGIAGLQDVLALVLAHPVAAATKAGTALYRLALPLLAMVLCVLMLRRRIDSGVILVWSGGLATLLRTAFLGWFFFIESRYLLPLVPGLEVASVVGLAWLLLGRRRDGQFARDHQVTHRPV